MKKYTVTFLISSNLQEVLMLYKFWGPYPNKYNGVGGKVENNEDITLSAIRECKEETGFQLSENDIRYLMTINFDYPVELNVFYAVVEKFIPVDSNEGVLKWMPIQFALDFNNPDLAGDGNIAYFIRAILLIIRSR